MAPADGRQVELFVEWTPDTCWSCSYAALGVDALVHEALRQTLMVLRQQADRAAARALETVAALWAACVDSDVDSRDLIDALEGGAANMCLTDDLRSAAARVRAGEHLRVAADNDAVVRQWVDVLDRQVAAARGMRG